MNKHIIMPYSEDLRQALKDEIILEIDFHKNYGTKDLWTAQAFGWLSILMGASSSVAAAYDAPKGTIGLFGALAGVLVAIDKVFAFPKRARWNAIYTVRLQKLNMQLKDPESDPQKIHDEYFKLKEDMINKFPDNGK